jgi:hypothetical protein
MVRVKMLPQPNWDYWLNFADVELRAAAALSCDVSPEAVEGEQPLSTWPVVSEVWRRTNIARSHIESRNLSTRRHATSQGTEEELVKLADFRTWAESLPVPFDFPDQFPKVAPSKMSVNAQLDSRWPWGNHETKYLRHIAAAADRFWENYDPNDPSTAPTSTIVSAWLQERGVAKRVAEIIAQILRADGLPPGPR